MSTKNRKQTSRKIKRGKKYHTLPKRLSEKEFEIFFLPYLSLPERGKKPKVPLWRIMNYILYQMDTGCQWEKIPIRTEPETGMPELHHASVFKWFKRWSEDGSFERAFVGSVARLKAAKKLRTKILHGDGTNSIAKKGAKT